MDGVTQLFVEKDQDVRAVIWSYGAVDIWCNKIHECRIAKPVYKPISRKEAVFHLKAGLNQLYVRLQTLGVRDTRTLFGIQLEDHKEEIVISLPDEERLKPHLEAEAWLGSISIRRSLLSFQSPAPLGASMAYDGQSPDFKRAKEPKEWQDISGESHVLLDDQKPGVILLAVSTPVGSLMRTVENIAAQRPRFRADMSFEENKLAIINEIASVESLSRGGKFGFSIANLLARRAVNVKSGRDKGLLLETLDQIEQRFDCSDFLVSGLLRYMKNYALDEQLAHRAKEVLLNWRYWMDQEGSDAMCFWSENHSLMFYTCAMVAGEQYPDDYFARAKMTGRQLHEMGKARVEWWLTDVEEHGFEEFLSTVYMCVTFAALLNVIDYSQPEISKRAAAVTDQLLAMLCRHTFDGSILAPMGRVYREVVHPFAQGAQALMNLICPLVPYSFGEGWLSFFTTTSYSLPPSLQKLMESPADLEYESGNALIRLKKTADYCMTSVQSPRRDGGFKRWENLTLIKSLDVYSCAYTKSLNERFHGTTCFEPSVYGYQQHMWYGALDRETPVFTNHPGGTCDSSSMRPGYWYGNGVMPAIVQEGDRIGLIYVIPREHPIAFTHAYFPAEKFDCVKLLDHWLLGEKKCGFLALWCSRRLIPADDQLFGCEFRAYGEEMAYLCVCGSKKEYGSLESFYEYVQSLSPVYDSAARTLTAGELILAYEECQDETQYV